MLSPEAERRHRGARLAVAIALTPAVLYAARTARDQWQALLSEVRATRELAATTLDAVRASHAQMVGLHAVKTPGPIVIGTAAAQTARGKSLIEAAGRAGARVEIRDPIVDDEEPRVAGPTRLGDNQ